MVLAGEILKEVKEHVEQGVSSQIIIKGLRRASQMAVNKIKEIAVNTSEGNRRDTLSKLAATAMTSKLIKRNTEFFTKSMNTFPTKPQRPRHMRIRGCEKADWRQWLSTPFYRSTKMTSMRSLLVSRRFLEGP